MFRLIYKLVTVALALLDKLIPPRDKSLAWTSIDDEDDKRSGTVAYVADSKRNTDLVYLVAQEAGEATPTLFIKNRADEVIGMRADCATIPEAMQMAEDLESEFKSTRINA